MKKGKDIFDWNNKSGENSTEKALNDLLQKNNLRFTDIDFEERKTDTLKNFNQLNDRLNKSPHLLKNLKSRVSLIPLRTILKPIYTIVLTTFVIFLIIELNKTNSPVKYAEITVDQGEKVNLHVTDEVEIWVNAGSTIKIPLEMNRNPQIYLDGEAYFEISKNKGKAIKVITKGLNFTTHNAFFNIESKNNKVMANVKEGQVELYNPKLPKDTKLNLAQHDQAIYNDKYEFIAVENNNSTNYLAWHTGIVKFNQTPMIKVAASISEIYDIPVVITNNKLLKSDFTARFKNANIDEILDTLQSTFNCEISADGSKIIIN